jgi:hypothetical protein
MVSKPKPLNQSFLYPFYLPWQHCKNSRIKKLGIKLSKLLIFFVSKLKAFKVDCHWAKICLDAIFSTSFFNMYFADLQSMLSKSD